MKRRLFYFTVMALLLSLMPYRGYAQDEPGGSDGQYQPCAMTVTTTSTSEGDVTLCYESGTRLGIMSFSCGGDGLGYTSQHGENGKHIIKNK